MHDTTFESFIERTTLNLTIHKQSSNVLYPPATDRQLSFHVVFLCGAAFALINPSVLIFNT